MTMVYDNRPATKDIDCIFSETNFKLLNNILELRYLGKDLGMIGNDYLQELYRYPDPDSSINQLLELLRCEDEEFIKSLATPIELDKCSTEELAYLTIVTALIDYNLQIHNLPIPSWIRDTKLRDQTPFLLQSLKRFAEVEIALYLPSSF